MLVEKTTTLKFLHNCWKENEEREIEAAKQLGKRVISGDPCSSPGGFSVEFLRGFDVIGLYEVIS